MISEEQRRRALESMTQQPTRVYRPPRVTPKARVWLIWTVAIIMSAIAGAALAYILGKI